MLARGARAFTLIEVLVVVVIVGIITSVVLLSTGLLDDDRTLRQEARRLASLVELAADEALLQGRDLGVDFHDGGYRFVEYDTYTERWFEIADDELLRPRQLPPDLRFELWIEDRPVALDAEARELDYDDDERASREPAYAPHALILSSGVVSPFDLRLLRDMDRSSMDVRVTPEGDIEFGEERDDAD